jgi:hypothetical protein
MGVRGVGGARCRALQSAILRHDSYGSRGDIGGRVDKVCFTPKKLPRTDIPRSTRQVRFVPERKCTCVSHTILRSRTLVPLQATIRLPCVHGGLGRIDLDQGLADTLGATYASEPDAAMMAGATQLSFWWRRSTLGSLLAIRLMQELAEETTGH